MIPKESEQRLRDTFGYYSIYFRKAADVMNCPRCHVPIFKKEKQVDFQAVIGSEFLLVECKQDATSWPWADAGVGIRPIQRQIMNDWWYNRQVHSYLYLLLGPGRAPKEKHAYLIPWEQWSESIENILIHLKATNIPWQDNNLNKSEHTNAQTLLKQYRLDFDGGIYKIPADHDFAIHFPDIYTLYPLPYWSKDEHSTSDPSTY